MNDAVAVVVSRSMNEAGEQPDLMELRARALVMHSVDHALRVTHKLSVIVSTDDEHVSSCVERAGGTVYWRKLRDGRGPSSTLDMVRSAVVAMFDEPPGIVVVLDPAMPLRRLTDIDDAIERVRRGDVIAVVGVVEERGNLWLAGTECLGGVEMGGSPTMRKVEFAEEPRYRETGSLYVFTWDALVAKCDSLPVEFGIQVMDRWSSFQIASVSDLRIASWIMDHEAHFVHWPDRLDLIVFDFDGVMTENGAYVDQFGSESVRVNRGDGWGIARLREAGIPMAVMSTESNPVVQRRCEKIGIECIQSVVDKRDAMQALMDRLNVSPEHVAFVGNDVNDLGALQMVGLPVVVADAHPMTISAASLVLRLDGGHGAVREFCDLVLEKYR
jgi:YrbI family 3-deoxy-D-manno-octulosonate 8-phosphate phosphatase